MLTDPKDEAEVQRLLSLDPFTRDRHIPKAAKDLKISVATLRAEIRNRSPAATGGPQGSEVSFPRAEPWPQRVDGAELLTEISEAIDRYVVLPRHGAEAIALWVVLTHCFALFDWIPKLGLISPEKRCGKTKTFECLQLLVSKALFASHTSPAFLFRVIGLHGPTNLMDEADTYSKDNQDLRNLLNASSQRDGTVGRCVGDSFEPRTFTVFTPIAYAMIGTPWSTVADRSIILQMKRKATTDHRFKFRRSEAKPQLQELASKAVRFVKDSASEIQKARPMPLHDLNDRDNDNWEGLISIADVAGGSWPAKARSAARALSGTKEIEAESLGVRLLADIRGLFQQPPTEALRSQDILEGLARIEEGPWLDWARTGKPIKAVDLAKLLRPYGIKPTTIRIGTQTPKGYTLAAFHDAFNRYLPPQPATPQQPNATEQGA